MIGQATDGSVLGIALVVVQVATPAALGLVAWLGKRLVDQNDRKIELLCRRVDRIEEEGHVTDKTATVGDERIKTNLAREYVGKPDHLVCRAEGREDRLRLFEKIEALKVSMGEVTGEMRGLRAAVEGLCRGIGSMIKGIGNDPDS